MSAINTISSDKLARLIGTAMCPAFIDVRVDGCRAMVALFSCSGTSVALFLWERFRWEQIDRGQYKPGA
jgi:uncharacterized membrane protein